ncbi:hypothetical protein HK098_007891 [Nowakowskiella sp. JEL0407]|nr:hypothetical protein HK098_007891 [Nowakowskiella sp. JEL0407]
MRRRNEIPIAYPPVSLLSLPTEIIHKIALFATRHRNAISDTLVKLSFSCKQLREILSPLLFQTIRITHGSQNEYARFKKFCDSCPSFASRIGKRTVNCAVELKLDDSHSNQIELVSLENLKSLEFEFLIMCTSIFSIDRLPLHSTIKEICRTYRNVRTLKLRNLLMNSTILRVLGESLRGLSHLKELSLQFTNIKLESTTLVLVGEISKFAHSLEMLKYLESFELINFTNQSFVPVHDIFVSLLSLDHLRGLTVRNVVIDETAMRALNLLIERALLVKLNLAYSHPTDITSAIQISDSIVEFRVEHIWCSVLSTIEAFRKLPEMFSMKLSTMWVRGPFDLDFPLETSRLQSFTLLGELHDDFFIRCVLRRLSSNLGDTLHDLRCTAHSVDTIGVVRQIIEGAKLLRVLAIYVDHCSAPDSFFDAITNSGSLREFKYEKVFDRDVPKLASLIKENSNLEKISIGISINRKIFTFFCRGAESKLKFIDFYTSGLISDESRKMRAEFIGAENVKLRLFSPLDYEWAEYLFKYWTTGNFGVDRIVLDDVLESEVDFMRDSWYMQGATRLGFEDGELCVLRQEKRVLEKSRSILEKKLSLGRTSFKIFKRSS